MPEASEKYRAAVLDAVAACTMPSRVDADGVPLPPERQLELPFEVLGFDSLCYMEFCVSLQVDTGFDLSVGTIQELGTPLAVAEYLQSLA